MDYRFVLEEEALHTLLDQRSTARRLLIKHFEALSDDPYRRGNFRETDADGRTVEIALEGRFLIAYWTDHAVKQVRITRLEVVRF